MAKHRRNREPMESVPVLTCCSVMQPVWHDEIPKAMRGTVRTCKKCEKPINIWKSIVESLAGWPPGYIVLAPLGVRLLLQTVDVIAGRSIELTLSPPLPASALVLSVNYTPNAKPKNGFVTPLEMHGNEPRRRSARLKLWIYGASLGGAIRRGQKVPTSVSVAWVDTEMAGEAWRNLAKAFEAFCEERFTELIVPASVAVELTTEQVLKELLRASGVTTDQRRAFSRNTDFSDHLHVLSLLTRFGCAPTLHSEARTALHELRRERNEMAHEGRPKRPVDQSRAARLLTAAAFGFHYALAVGEKLLPNTEALRNDR